MPSPLYPAKRTVLLQDAPCSPLSCGGAWPAACPGAMPSGGSAWLQNAITCGQLNRHPEGVQSEMAHSVQHAPASLHVCLNQIKYGFTNHLAFKATHHLCQVKSKETYRIALAAYVNEVQTRFIRKHVFIKSERLGGIVTNLSMRALTSRIGVLPNLLPASHPLAAL